MKLQPRKIWTCKRYRQMKVGDDTVFIVIVNDLDNDQLKWHFDRAVDEQDYEYAGACQVEADLRGVGELLN